MAVDIAQVNKFLGKNATIIRDGFGPQLAGRVKSIDVDAERIVVVLVNNDQWVIPLAQITTIA